MAPILWATQKIPHNEPIRAEHGPVIVPSLLH